MIVYIRYRREHMTEPQRRRLEEVIFVQYVETTLNRVSNPSKLYVLMENIAVMYDGNGLTLKKIVSEVLCRREIYRASTIELRTLAHYTTAPLDTLLRLLGVSRATYYRTFDEARVKPPQFCEEYGDEIHAFLMFLKETADLLALGGLL